MSDRKVPTGVWAPSELMLHEVIDAALDGMVVIDSRGTVLLYNAACERMFGYARHEVLGKNVNLLMTAPDHENHDTYLRNYLRSGTPRVIGIGRDVVGQRKDGSTIPLRLAVGELRQGADPPLFIGTLHDLTQQRRDRRRIDELQSELMRVTRVSAVGQMGASLAHELTQPLAAIVGFVEASAALLARAGDDVPAQVHEYMDRAVTQAHRAGEVVRHLRDFTRRGATEREVGDINAVVEEALELATLGSAGRGIELRLDLARDLPPVFIDQAQIQQVVLNLVRNSLDALSGGDAGAVVIRTRRRGKRVEVTVEDNGPGLARDARERIFDPFVSTKPDGLGIGLSICRTIIEAHGGEIVADARPARGATFRVAIPVFDEGEGQDAG